ncbi:MAG: hypothetical protein IKN27_02640 [Selenomonadaceae bacterium]|nr:hypothetical protein [Selenomonadaceae bacterium]
MEEILRTSTDGHGVNPILDTCPQFWGYPLRRATKPATTPSLKFALWLADAICLTSPRALGCAEMTARDTYIVEVKFNAFNRP